MSGEPRQRKLGSTDADGNWQLGSPTAANGEKTQTVTGYKRRAPTAATDDAPFNAGNLQAAVRHNAAKEKEEDKTVEAKPADEGEQPVPKAEEEQAAAAKLNENPATPVPKHVLLANVKSESTLDSDGTDKHPIDVTGTVRGTSIALLDEQAVGGLAQEHGQ
jgi:hypothetical protein